MLEPSERFLHINNRDTGIRMSAALMLHRAFHSKKKPMRSASLEIEQRVEALVMGGGGGCLTSVFNQED